MKAHYHPYGGDDESEQALCGVWLGDSSEFRMRWDQVTCGACLRNRQNIEAAIRTEEAAILEQMNDWAEWYKQQEPSHDNQ